MRTFTRLFVLAFLAPWVISCASNDLPESIEVDCTGFKTVSYVSHIKPIVDRVCSNCHNPSNPTKDWTNPELLKEHADEASRRVRLPSVDPHHMPQEGEITLEEIQNIACWAEQGAPIDN